MAVLQLLYCMVWFEIVVLFGAVWYGIVWYGMAAVLYCMSAFWYGLAWCGFCHVNAMFPKGKVQKKN